LKTGGKQSKNPTPPSASKPKEDHALGCMISTDQLLIACPDPGRAVGACPDPKIHYHKKPSTGYALRKKMSKAGAAPPPRPLPRFTTPCRYGDKCKKAMHDHRFDQFPESMLKMGAEEMSNWKKLIPSPPPMDEETPQLEPLDGGEEPCSAPVESSKAPIVVKPPTTVIPQAKEHCHVDGDSSVPSLVGVTLCTGPPMESEGKNCCQHGYLSESSSSSATCALSEDVSPTPSAPTIQVNDGAGDTSVPLQNPVLVAPTAPPLNILAQGDGSTDDADEKPTRVIIDADSFWDRIQVNEPPLDENPIREVDLEDVNDHFQDDLVPATCTECAPKICICVAKTLAKGAVNTMKFCRCCHLPFGQFADFVKHLCSGKKPNVPEPPDFSEFYGEGDWEPDLQKRVLFLTTKDAERRREECDRKYFDRFGYWLLKKVGQKKVNDMFIQHDDKFIKDVNVVDQYVTDFDGDYPEALHIIQTDSGSRKHFKWLRNAGTKYAHKKVGYEYTAFFLRPFYKECYSAIVDLNCTKLVCGNYESLLHMGVTADGAISPNLGKVVRYRVDQFGIPFATNALREFTICYTVNRLVLLNAWNRAHDLVTHPTRPLNGPWAVSGEQLPGDRRSGL
jgi:hypothetical protein